MSPPAIVRNLSLGPFIGTLITWLLYGATAMQTYQYYNTYVQDPKRVKALVAFIFALETIHTSLADHYTYWYLIEHFGETERLMDISWSVGPSVIVGFVIAWTVNQFFVRRIYVLSKKNLWLSITIGVLATIRPVNGFAVAALLFVYPQWPIFKHHAETMMIVGLSLGLLVDCLIALTVSYFLVQNRNTTIASTRSIINSLLKYTLNTGVILMVFAALELIGLLALPKTLSFLGLFQIQIQLYANCFLTNLNARDAIRRDNTPMVNLSSDHARHNRTQASSAGIEIKTETFVAVDGERRKSGLSMEKIPPHQHV